jgi:hypothetical protein
MGDFHPCANGNNVVLVAVGQQYCWQAVITGNIAKKKPAIESPAL